MSAYSVSAIQIAVKTILDSNGYSSAISGTNEGQYLDDIIEGIIVPSARYVLVNAPLHLVSEAATSLSTCTDTAFDDNKGKKFTLPAGFLRFVYGKLSDWKVPIDVLLPEGSLAYAAQSKVGACANPMRPIGFLTEGGQYAELYGSRAVSGLTGSISYIIEPSVSSSSISIPNAAYQPFLYQTAGMTAAQTQEDKLAESLLAIAKSLMS